MAGLLELTRLAQAAPGALVSGVVVALLGALRVAAWRDERDRGRRARETSGHRAGRQPERPPVEGIAIPPTGGSFLYLVQNDRDEGNTGSYIFRMSQAGGTPALIGASSYVGAGPIVSDGFSVFWSAPSSIWRAVAQAIDSQDPVGLEARRSAR